MDTYDLKDLRVLVVEDSDFMRELFVSMLTELGVGEVVDVASGDLAIDELSKTAQEEPGAPSFFDVVFSDWAMDGGDGLQLLRWIRSHNLPEIRFLPFIMVSAYSTLDWVLMARDTGVNEFLTKPVSVKSVIARLVSIIEKPRAYVKSAGYFGPDRRRRNAVFNGEDRRKKRA